MEDMTLELLREYIAAKQIRKLRSVFDEYNIVDLAELVGQLALDEALFLFKTLKKDITAELFTYLPNEKQHRLISLFTGEEIKEMLDNLYTDDIVDFLEELPANIVKNVLNEASPQQRSIVNKLLSYKDYTAGSIMSTNYVELEEEDTVTQAMRKIKSKGKMAETINYCFIVNDHNVLVGMVSLRDILFAPENEVIEELMSTDLILFKTSDDQEEVVKAISKYDITIVPIVDDNNRLVGIITVDDVIDALEEEATEDIHKMGAITPIDGSYLQTTPFKMSISRLTWLMILMISYAFSSLIITHNQGLLIAIPSLITFIPMLMDTAGNAGSQASAMVIRGIVVDDLTIKDFFKVLWKEMQVAILCGIVLFIVNSIRIAVFVSNAGWDMALMVSITLFCIILVAKLVGGLLPLIALIIKADPAAMASPLIATACDALSLTIYFGLAHLFFRL